MEFSVREHIDNGRLVLAVCDTELIGKRITDGKVVLDCACSFYSGKNVEESKLGELFKKAYIINAVGRNAVGLCKEKGLVDEDAVITVNEVPHCQIVVVADE